MGKSPLELRPHGANPILTARDVTDVPGRFIADPFVVRQGKKFYMFFEVLNLATDKGEIGLAVSNDGLLWHYRQIILREPFHLSYPYVFPWKNSYYLIPESCEAGAVRLYRANRFPFEWSFLATLLNGRYVDPSIFYYCGRWWLFVGANSKSELYLYHAPEPTGPWIDHPRNPVVVGYARPAGRPFALGNRIFRVAQGGDTEYGLNVRVFEISVLTELDYEENELAESPLLQGSGTGWNAKGMHHMDAYQLEDGSWSAVVDGWTMALVPRVKRLEQSFCSARCKFYAFRLKGPHRS
jgi:hypothetical protein